MGHSVLVILETMNKVVDRLEYYAGQINYLLWSPDGKEMGEISVFLDYVTIFKLHSKEMQIERTTSCSRS